MLINRDRFESCKKYRAINRFRVLFFTSYSCISGLNIQQFGDEDIDSGVRIDFAINFVCAEWYVRELS